MTHYLLSVHMVEGEARKPMTDDEMKQSYATIGALEQEMRSNDALRFSGRLTEPKDAAVVRASGGTVVTTDGPFAETKEQIGGFYIIEAADLDSALGWAAKVTDAINAPIEVRPFAHVA
ncbi:MAG TPA: YciI family protein [Actinomycetes bacterium]|nr:YciI family protein [Actinomycetes bacterium]